MVVALFGLSLVMILGGIASVVQGFPYVRLESGLALVIGGTTAASAGAVLLGLAAVVVRLKRVEEALGEMPSGVVSMPASMPISMPVALAREIAPLPPTVAPAAAGAAGLAGSTLGGLAAEPPRPAPVPEPPREAEPVLPHLLSEDEPAPPAPRAVEPPPAEPALPELRPEEDLFATTQAGRDEPPPLRSSLGEPDGEEVAVPREGAPAQPHAKANPVVGTYASGANTYVMFADGTIEADTPRGRFTFRSLDELKAFVEAGGESDARGAA